MSMNLAELIDQAYDDEENKQEETPRNYIGASGVGNPCDAYLAFCLRGFPNSKLGFKLRRIFRDGHRIEQDVLKDIGKTSMKVIEKDPYTHKQWAYYSYGGHAVGHADGVIEDENGNSMLLEVKSMNERKFNEFEKHGVKYSHKNYYSQVQFMMGMSSMEECLFIAYCKNNSKYFSQIVPYDEFHYNELRTRIETVLRGEAQKISADSTDWRCRGCFKREVCWEEKEPKKEMRTCVNCKPKSDGKWECTKGCQGECQDWQPYQPLPKI